MAIYEYNCGDCGTHFEARRPMSEANAPIACPECGGYHAERGLSSFFAVRGSSGGGGAAVSRSSASSGCASCSSHSCASCGH